MTALTELTPAADLSGRRVLIVDDDRLNRRVLAGILRPEGYELAEAESGEQALERYAEFEPDLVLLDVVLPGIDGFEACRRLHAQHGVDTAPVVFITARSESEDIVTGFSAGGVDYLPKPFRPREVAVRIRTHLENRRLLEQQRSLADQLARANTAKNRFLGMAAHDLRSPLASVRGLAELLRDGVAGELTPSQVELVSAIHSASDQMLVLVSDLLDATTIEAGELRLELTPEPLAQLVQRTVTLNAINATPKGTQLVFEPPAGAAATARALVDPARLKQVVDNLLSNAIKFSPRESIITVTLEADAAHVFIAVRDQGPGIPEGERDKLFKDFSRLSVRPTGGEKSTGLGLAISRKIVEAHRGTIAAENLPSPGRGCVFRVTLPLYTE